MLNTGRREENDGSEKISTVMINITVANANWNYYVYAVVDDGNNFD